MPTLGQRSQVASPAKTPLGHANAAAAGLSYGRLGEFLFAGRRRQECCLTTRPYARLLSAWIDGIGLEPSLFGASSIWRTKATLNYRPIGDLRAVQVPLGHMKVERTGRYLGVEVDDALNIAEQVDI